MRNSSLLAGVGVPAAVIAGLALSTQAAAENNQNAQIRPLLMVEWAAPSDMLTDPRDSGFARAIGMLPDRLREMQHELPHFPREALRAIDLAQDTLSTSGRFALFYNDANPGLGMFGYGMILSFDASGRAEAQRLDRGYRSMLDMAGPLPFQPSQTPRFEGVTEFATPVGSFGFGPRQSGDRWAFSAFAGAVDDFDTPFSALPEQEGDANIRLRGVVDLRALEPGMNMARAFAGGDPDVANMFKEIEESGMFGPEAPSFHFVYGSDAERSFSTVRTVNARKFTQTLATPVGDLDRDALRAVPADATLAFVSYISPSGLISMFEDDETVRETMEEFFWEFRERTGIHLRDDLIDTLSDQSAFYMSDTTGSGGLMSSVMLIGVEDHTTLRNTINRGATIAREAIREQGEYNEVAGRLRIAPWAHADQSYHSVRFDGVPIPLDITFAITDDWLIVGMTPQAVVGAVEHIRSGEPGLDTKPFLEGRTVSAVSFVDTERFARNGYGGLSMIGSAVAAGVRSTHAGRDPGMIVPIAKDLFTTARPSYQIGYWEGDDFIQYSESDTSVLVQLSAGVGIVKEFVPIIAGGMAIFTINERRYGGMNPRRRWGMLDAEDLMDIIRFGARGPDPYAVALAAFKAGAEQEADTAR